MMLLTTIFAVIVIFCIAVSAPDRQTERGMFSAENEILVHENELWQSFMEPRAVTTLIEQRLAPDSVGVTASGILVSVEEKLAYFKRCSIASFTIHNPRVCPLSADLALLVYQITVDGTDGSHEKVPHHLDITTMWVRRSDNWQIQLHTQTSAKFRRLSFRSETFGETMSA
jgi:Domain of unknown function (DUF4440)